MRFLNIKDLKFNVKNKKILENINFHLEKGEILSIIGPSGAGKSSILKLLAGLSQPTYGNITLSNKIISSQNILLPTGDRNIGLMFQEEVLFPHLSVYKNIAFGIEHLKISNKENLIKKYLRKFGLLNLQKSFPEELSSGEKQRVSLARILITKPKVLLMDEPFSNLDKNLRIELCDYTIKILKEKNISVIFVTHDINEALRVSDRIIVLKNGKIQQIDTPENVYSYPKNKYIASLIGDINIFKVQSNNEGLIDTPFGKIKCRKYMTNKTKIVLRCNHYCVIRPSDLFFSKIGVDAKIISKHFLGSSWEYKVFINESFPIFKLHPSKEQFCINDKIKVNVELKNILIFEE